MKTKLTQPLKWHGGKGAFNGKLAKRTRSKRSKHIVRLWVNGTLRKIGEFDSIHDAMECRKNAIAFLRSVGIKTDPEGE